MFVWFTRICRSFTDWRSESGRVSFCVSRVGFGFLRFFFIFSFMVIMAFLASSMFLKVIKLKFRDRWVFLFLTIIIVGNSVGR